MEKKFSCTSGKPFPFGVSHADDGWNFALFSRHATAVSLCLFDSSGPLEELKLDRTGDVWHICVRGLRRNLHYGYRVDGPYDPLRGLFFDNRTVLLDPYAKEIARPKKWGKGHKPLGVLSPSQQFDWEDDHHPQIPLKELIIYEMHVRGFTQDKSSGATHPGTFLGMIEKIPHLKQLGVNAVELLPIHAFHEWVNQYWGYATVNFFAQMRPYGTIHEFKTLVKALHAEGIEVILDVVFNHTAEGNEAGPLLSYKGLENPAYYLLGPNGEYYNFSGCGNTFNCNHPVVRELIRDSLRYWVTEMHVDGFRFDLASILTRDHDGIPLERPPLIEAITFDPTLAHTKLIAEAWDAGGLYQVGSFPGFGRWAEWNGKYRDHVRRFIKGTDGETGHFARSIAGSEGLFDTPEHSINYVTAHDGFTLRDLVSYNEKHNEANGEEGRDGDSNNESWNCGEEGETSNEEVRALRERQMRNFLVALMVSQGVPMLRMGDEYGHTANGNNNTWAHDSRLNWFLWEELDSPLFRFTRLMIAFRKSHPILTRSHFLRDGDITWHGVDIGKHEWEETSRAVAFTLPDPEDGTALYVAFNAYHEPLTFHLPDGNWSRVVDTSKPPPDDFLESPELVTETLYTLPAHTSLILTSL